MGILVLVIALFSANTAEFRTITNKQLKEGYSWNYVGKQAPSGSPAITIKPQSGDEYILFRLEKWFHHCIQYTHKVVVDSVMQLRI